jgi:hypothetical protein
MFQIAKDLWHVPRAVPVFSTGEFGDRRKLLILVS